MSLHSSLKRSASAGRHRNVLKREERLAKLADDEKWEESKDSLYGLPKVRSIKVRVKKKKKKEEAEGEAAVGEAAVGEAPAGEAAAPSAGAEAQKK